MAVYMDMVTRPRLWESDNEWPIFYRVNDNYSKFPCLSRQQPRPNFHLQGLKAGRVIFTAENCKIDIYLSQSNAEDAIQKQTHALQSWPKADEEPIPLFPRGVILAALESKYKAMLTGNIDDDQAVTTGDGSDWKTFFNQN